MKKELYGALVFHQNVLSEKKFSGGRITVGTDASADFCIDVPDFDDIFAIIEGGSLHLRGSMSASLSAGGKQFCIGQKRGTAADAQETYAFGEDDWCILNLSDGLDLLVCFRNAEALPLVGTPAVLLSDMLQSPLARMLVLSFALHSAVIFIAGLTARPQETFEYKTQADRWIELVSTVEEHAEEEEKKEEIPVIEDTDDVIIDDSMKQENREKIDDTDSKIANLDKVDKPVGLQAALGGAKLHDMESLFGSSAGLGNAWDYMPETAEGDAFGTGAGFGAGLSGIGIAGGGGGGGYGAGIGGIAGGGGGGNGGSAKAAGPKKSSVKRKPKLNMDTPKQGAFCKESNIRDVVQKRANALRSCYEQQLLANPDLSGKIIVFWKIGLDGKVADASIKSSTMNNSKVESCLTQTVRRLRFDPPDGGICVIEFPFIFTAAQ